jgi:hypothetical protein
MNYTPKQKAFIKSKVKRIKWEEISEGMRQFWSTYKNIKNETTE